MEGIYEHVRFEGRSFPEGERAEWRRRGALFAGILESIAAPREHPRFQDVIGPIEALCLGEKPMAESPLEALAIPMTGKMLAQFGVAQEGRYFYSPALAERVIAQYLDRFREYGAPDVARVVRTLSDLGETDLDTDAKARMHLALGTLFGYPEHEIAAWLEVQDRLGMPEFLKALRMVVHTYGTDTERTMFPIYLTVEGETAHYAADFFRDLASRRWEELGINRNDLPMINRNIERFFSRRLVNVYGVRWLEYGPSSEESLKLQARLRAAFEASGLVDTTREWHEQ